MVIHSKDLHVAICMIQCLVHQYKCHQLSSPFNHVGTNSTQVVALIPKSHTTNKYQQPQKENCKLSCMFFFCRLPSNSQKHPLTTRPTSTAFVSSPTPRLIGPVWRSTAATSSARPSASGARPLRTPTGLRAWRRAASHQPRWGENGLDEV